jgi:DNA polymerase
VTFAAESSLARQVAGALDWWREAGVDLAFADAPTGWLAAEPAPETPAPRTPVRRPEPAEAPRARIGDDDTSWPASLAEFAGWWLSEPSLDNGQTAGRIAPAGPAGAPLLVLVEQPESVDRDRLLAGGDGKLARAIVAALGIAPNQVYFASVLPRTTPHADWAGLTAQGLGDVLLHHLRLAAPQRVLAFGGNILPLLGHDPAKSPEILLQLNQEGSQVPVLAVRDLSTLRAKPAWKAGLWRRLLDWMG